MHQSEPSLPPRDHAAPSIFQPAYLLREARRQKRLPDRDVPEVCVLDPDGDLVRHLRTAGRAKPSPGWACYHTKLIEFVSPEGSATGVVGCAVGAPFAVLVAEQLFASGCRFLVSVTSAGVIAAAGEPPYVVLIDRALRDEGTSAHYVSLDSGPFMAAPDPALIDRVEAALRAAFQGPGGVVVHRGATWTTDAPYRETQAAIDHARGLGVLAVEMEAAALYALATARGFPIICLAHVTNTMGQDAGHGFEKGDAHGSVTALRLIEATASAFWKRPGR